MEIRNIGDLREALDPCIMEAMEKTRQYVAEKIEESISGYYTEQVFQGSKGLSSDPREYKRTYRLMNSFNAGNVKKNKNKYEFTVGWPNSYLKFKYKNPTGFQVLTWFNAASHGGNVDGEHMFWDEALSNMGGEQGIKNRFLGELRATGVSVS